VPDRHLALEQVSVSFGPPAARVQAANNVSLAFEPGTLTLLMGPSGSGKTTLLSLLGCLLRPDSGQVFVNGADMGSLNEAQRTRMRRRNIGFIFQAFRLFHSLSAFENVMIAAEISHSRNAEHRDRARTLLRNLGLGERLNAKPAALSGGEKQRVAIARSLLANPPVLLADEPTASLDSASGRRIFEILRYLADSGQRTLVVVTHDVRWQEFAHRTLVLEDGRVVADSAPPPLGQKLHGHP
jgi:putative ABC transport system ATP-binding protein